MSDSDIQVFVEKKSKWIEKHLVKEQPEDNEPHAYYLGKKYRIRLRPDGKRRIYLVGGEMIFSGCASVDEKLLESWYKERAEIEFSQSIDRSMEKVAHLGIKRPIVSQRKMSSRWGSCHITKGKVVLARRLIKFDRELIDSVMIHELMHFKVHGHGQDFYRLLESVLPDYKTMKKFLDRRTTLSGEVIA